MQSSLLRITVALLTFGVGVSATMFWIAYRMPDVKRLEAATRYAHLPSPLPGRLSRAPISGNLIKHKTLSKPAPIYPAAAVAANASGTVDVRVLVDESGRVIAAKAVSGDSLLREAAVDAAYQARFSPTLSEGLAVKVSGIISYDFVLP